MSSDMMIGPARDAGWVFVEIDTPRKAMMTRPELVAETLLDFVCEKSRSIASRPRRVW
jgi:hypothetical protein